MRSRAGRPRRKRTSEEESGSGSGRGVRIAAAVPCGAVLLQSHATQEGRGTRTVGKRAENANRILAVNSDAGGKAWFFKLKISDKSELGGLMDEAAYAKHTA